LLACGDGNPVEAPPTFPRAFTSQSVECRTGIRFESDTVGGQRVFIEETRHETVESSNDDFFAGRGFVRRLDIYEESTGDLIETENSAKFLPDAVDGVWDVTLTPAVDWTWNAVGVGDGDLSGRSIEFRMRSISDCGYESTGTIR